MSRLRWGLGAVLAVVSLLVVATSALGTYIVTARPSTP